MSHLGEANAGDAPGSSLERVRGLVAGILAARLPGRAFSDHETLAEIGITSMDMVTLLLSVENEFDLEIPQQEITPEVFRSISTIDALLRRLLPQASAA